MSTQTYLDYAAATPLDASVLTAMEPYFSQRFYNPSATYNAARAVRADVEAARALVAHWLGSRPSEVLFTAGGTEANNIAIHGVMRQFPGANMVYSAVEHESVRAPAECYEARQVDVDGSGRVAVDAIRQVVDDNTVLVSCMYANNEVGTVQPVRDVAQLVSEIRRDRSARGVALPLYLHTDACQAANYLDLHVARLGVDLLTLNGGKIYGPKQSGVLYVKAGITLLPLVDGGGQERGLRSGTENVPAIVGLAAALQYVQSDRHQEVARIQRLQNRFFDAVQAQLPDVEVNGSRKHRLPNNVHLTVPGADNERLLILLDEAGVIAAAGSACSASREEVSHVLSAMGISDANAQSSLRFTLGRQTTEDDVDRAVSCLVAACSESK